MRPQFGANFIRLKSLGEFYSETVLRNRLLAKRVYERQLEEQIKAAENSKAPNLPVLKTMRFYIIAFSGGYMPVRKKNPKHILTWKNDAELDRLTALNAKINNGATLDSLRADMEKKAQAVHEIERTIENSKITDPEVAAKLSIALQSTQQLKEASDWVTTAEQVLGGSYLQCVSDIERHRKESKYLPNGIRTADGEPLPDAPISHRGR